VRYHAALFRTNQGSACTGHRTSLGRWSQSQGRLRQRQTSTWSHCAARWIWSDSTPRSIYQGAITARTTTASNDRSYFNDEEDE
jgi:hypothetical protein